MYQHLQLDKTEGEKKRASLVQEAEKKGKKGKTFEAELGRIEKLCKDFGVPDPDELYVIPRDYENLTGNPNLTQFDTKMPDGLARWVEEEEFQYTMSQINQYLAQAEKIDCRTVMDGIGKYLTCFMIRAFQRSRMERAILKVRNFIVEQNQDVYHPKGFHIVEPGVRGMRHIEFRSITYYSMKYFLEHEDEIPVNESDANMNSRTRTKSRASPGKRSVSSNFKRNRHSD